MRQQIISCDDCHAILSTIYSLAVIPGEFCFECMQKVQKPVEEEEVCVHEENASDQAQGRTAVRLICKQCGYDRVEEVA